MMSDAIKHVPQQFTYQPVIENARVLKPYDQIFFIGMGGSHLAADLALLWNPNLPMSVTSDYGLPTQIKHAKRPLVIAGSYSGNTEETLDGYRLARKQQHALAVIASGGTLIDLAKKDGVPYIQIPNTGIQPRMATGFALRALLKLVGDEKGLKESAQLADTLNPHKLKKQANALTKKLIGTVPVIYSSHRNGSIASNWKIKFNETGKIPAFYNQLPELNHNEMNGFDVQPSTQTLSQQFSFIFLSDKQDHPRIQKRMQILERFYLERSLPVTRVELVGNNPFEKSFTSLVIADWTAVGLADHYGLDSEQVPMVEAFKTLMK